ncbi:uncharacterized protein LOC119089718 [Pollicipes pollicipes]|uniref:uncharacterized protein LOC119089718 n=1 Tax=Pollicipes pollicipes TaxID=41117 RepID=UPI00188596D4|nr:uncharacterized protein LOC119089718 [Pollicipes pollicipes]
MPSAGDDDERRSRSGTRELGREVSKENTSQTAGDATCELPTAGSSADMFTAVYVTTHSDSASDSSRAQIPRPFDPNSAPERPLLAGGLPRASGVGLQRYDSPCGMSVSRSTTPCAVSTQSYDPPYGTFTPRSSAPRGVSVQRSEPTCGEMSRPAAAPSRPGSSASAAAAGRGPAVGRCSPAASEASRTESALAPPSDASGTESARHLAGGGEHSRHLAAGAEEAAPHKARAASGAHQEPASSGAAQTVSDRPVVRRDDRPWYEVSDDD